METLACGACDEPMGVDQPRFWFGDKPFHIECVPAEHASRAQALLGVKSC